MEDALGVELVRIELTQVADIEDTVVGNGRRDHVTLRSRDIDHSLDLAIRSDLVHLAMIRLDGVEVTPQRDHAVPCAVRFKVTRDGIRRVRHRMRLLIRAKISDDAK